MSDIESIQRSLSASFSEQMSDMSENQCDYQSFNPESVVINDELIITDSNVNYDDDECWRKISDEFLHHYRRQTKRLYEICFKMTRSSERREKIIKELSEKLLHKMDSLVKREQSNLESCLEEIDSLKREIETILSQVVLFMPESRLRKHLRISTGSTVEEQDIHEQSCIEDQLDQLKTMRQSLIECRDQHMSMVVDLQDKLRKLIEILGINACDHDDYAHLLSAKLLDVDELEMLRQELSDLHILMHQRQLFCAQMARQICFIVRLVPLPRFKEETFLIDYLDFNKDPLQDYCIGHHFVYSEKNIEILKDYLNQCQIEFESCWQSIQSKFEQLEQMYSLFELQDTDNHIFNLVEAILNKYDHHLKQHQDKKNMAEFLLENWNSFHFPKDINDLACIQKQLDEDYNHYEQLKSSRMEEIINRIREQFASLSDKCMINFESLIKSNDHYRQLFQKSDNYNAELLEAHESELSQLKQYYNEYEKLFTLITQCHKLQEEINECEQRSRDVYTTKNRGGIMLQILNKKRSTQKRLLHVQEQLRKWYDEYCHQQENNDLKIPFDYYGFRIEDIINIS
ncbi:hypothetical protein DERP_000322 [Dermatophagoides pteronyssinus]|uniref:Uncharacterized protein n=2 Tax=Dermatophagoides pteronyssinus TaxID=6956 RepID=A0ABQ8IZW1_DERPT|nr:protein regulator of cytokinesis 1-like [Dermatophagoides pteronyssinus]KAH9415828.1 hypothetical protein DERP_000322 [Dermatophagoides pteronyssinus]